VNVASVDMVIELMQLATTAQVLQE